MASSTAPPPLPPLVCPTHIRSKDPFGALSPVLPPRSSGTREWIQPGVVRGDSLHPPTAFLPGVSHPAAMEGPGVLPMTPPLQSSLSKLKGGAGPLAYPARPHTGPASGGSARSSQPTLSASARALQSAARPQLARCLRAPITASITAPEAVEENEGTVEGEGQTEAALLAPDWLKPVQASLSP